MWVCLRPDLAERMVKDSAGQERPIKLGPKLWVSCSNFDAFVRWMSRLYQTVYCARQGKSTVADLYPATETCGSSVMTHTSRLQLFASLVDERAHFRACMPRSTSPPMLG